MRGEGTRPRAVVTGATGFVGGAMVRHLMDAGYDVMAVTRSLPKGRQLPADCEVRETDWTLPSLTNLLRESRPTSVFHFAGRTDVGKSFESPDEYVEANVLLSTRLLEAVRLSRLTPISVVLAGSMHEYWLPTVARGISETWPRVPSSPYGYSKWMQGEMAAMYRNLYSLPVVTARLFNLMGPGARAGVVAQLVRVAVGIERGEREPVIRIGSTTMTRDFLDVRDAARALLAIAQAAPIGTDAVNVCSGVDTSLGQIASEIAGHLDVPCRQEVHPPFVRPGEPEVVCGDTAKLRELTGWSPQISVSQSLSDALDYARHAANRQKGEDGHEGDDDSRHPTRDHSAIHYH